MRKFLGDPGLHPFKSLEKQISMSLPRQKHVKVC
jgi:hypothetical protein